MISFRENPRNYQYSNKKQICGCLQMGQAKCCGKEKQTKQHDQSLDFGSDCSLSCDDNFVMMVLWMHTYVKTHQNVYFKCVLFITC